MTVLCKDDTPRAGQQERQVRIWWNPELRTIATRDMMVTLTPTECRFLSPLLHGKPVTYTNMARQTYNRALDTKVRKLMDKHIDRIRGKLQGTGAYIYCILNYGYILLDEVSPEEGV